MLAERFGILGDLDGELTCRRENEDPRLTRSLFFRGCLSRFCQNALESRDQERSRLAGAGLRLAGNVLAAKGDGQGTRLDRRRKLEARISNARTQ